MTDNRTAERVDHSPRVREAINELMREKDAADNRATELREKLDSLSIEHFDFDKGGRTQTMWEAPDGKRHFTYETSDNPAKTARLVIAWFPTPEQAISVTFGSERHAYEQRITGDGSDWGEIMRDAYDELMAAACESCTPEQMEQLADYISAELGNARATHGTLTAEQVRELIVPHLDARPTFDFGRYGAVWRADFQAIADELNACVGRTCKIIEWYEARDKHERGNNRVRFSCGDFGTCHNKFCPECGAKVVE